MLHPSFEIEAGWGARISSPSTLARLLLDTLAALEPLHADFRSWNWGDMQEVWETEGEGGSHSFAEIRGNLIPAIERNAGTGQEGVPDPFYGYLMVLITAAPAKSGSVLSIDASNGINGGSAAMAFVNRARFELAPAPEASLISYDLLKAVLLILAETWQATWAYAVPGNLPLNSDGRPVCPAWMSYVSPHYASLMTPPASAIVERRPKGGLFLASTRDVFQMDNPEHLAVAREIEAALQPLNRVPNPNDAPYL